MIGLFSPIAILKEHSSLAEMIWKKIGPCGWKCHSNLKAQGYIIYLPFICVMNTFKVPKNNFESVGAKTGAIMYKKIPIFSTKYA